MKIAITGHLDIERCFNIKQVDNSIYDLVSYNSVFQEIELYLMSFATQKNIDFTSLELVSGMARGVDEIFALIAIKHNLKLTISIPKSIHYHRNKKIKSAPNLKIQALNYDDILSYNKLTIIEVNDNLNKGNYGYFLARNKDMVERSDYVLSYKCYDSTGTNDCIDRARKASKYIGNVKS